jgi:hypothetical protein
MEEKRLVTGQQELIDGESVLGDLRDIGGQAIEVRPDFVDGGLHASMMRRFLHEGRESARGLRERLVANGNKPVGPAVDHFDS